MYTPKPSIVSTLSEHLKSGKLKPAYLFYGEEEYLKQYYLKALTTEFCGKGSEPVILEGGTFDLDAFKDCVENVSFSTSGNMVIVRNLELNKGLTTSQKADFLAVLSNLDGGSMVVLFYDAMFLEDAAYETIAKRNDMLKSLMKYCFPCDFAPQSEGELLKWIPKALGAQNLKITEKNALYLIDVVGKDMLTLRSEIEKIAMAASGGEVTAAVIDLVTSGSRGSDVFGLARDILAGKTRDALVKIADCRRLKEEPVGVLSIVATTFTEAALIKSGADSGVRSIDAIISAFGMNPKKKRFFTDYLNMSTGLDAEFFSESLEMILETDRKMKESSFDKWTLLEALCVRIARCRR